MSRNDIVLATPERFGTVRRHQVIAGAASTIKAGEPVMKTLGAAGVVIATTNKPVVATDFFVGIAAADSTDTVLLDGYVDVVSIDRRDTWSIAPKSTTAYATQSAYNALVGDRNLLDLTASAWTILASDGATSGCVIQNLFDIQTRTGQVLFSFREGVDYLA